MLFIMFAWEDSIPELNFLPGDALMTKKYEKSLFCELYYLVGADDSNMFLFTDHFLAIAETAKHE